MTERNEKKIDPSPSNEGSDDYLNTLKEVERQYQQYIDVSELYKLPNHTEQESIQYQPPSLEHPLTTNTIHIK